jgi:hypothetical protein
MPTKIPKSRLFGAGYKLKDAGRCQPCAAEAYERGNTRSPEDGSERHACRHTEQEPQGEVRKNRQSHNFRGKNAIGANLREQNRRNLKGQERQRGPVHCTHSHWPHRDRTHRAKPRSRSKPAAQPPGRCAPGSPSSGLVYYLSPHRHPGRSTNPRTARLRCLHSSFPGLFLYRPDIEVVVASAPAGSPSELSTLFKASSVCAPDFAA